MTDAEKIVEWQKTKSPQLYFELMQQYNPMIHKTVNQYKTTGLSVPTLKARAQENFINALDSYKPEFKTQPMTHIYNHLRRVQRHATESITSGRIPEHRNLKMATFNTVKKSLEDELGREPSAVEIADELGWSPRQVEVMEKEIGGEVSASGAPMPFYGNSVSFEHKDLANAEYLYHSDIPNQDRVILEHTFGFYGKPVLNNKQIAQQLHTNEMAISRSKKKLSDMLKKYR